MKTAGFSFLLLLSSLINLSCNRSSNLIPESSLDFVSQVFNGSSPSYSGSLPDNSDDLSFNMACLVMLSVGGSFPSSGQFDRQPASPTLLASARKQLSFGSAYASPKPTSFFQSEHFAIMSGLELVRKGSKINDRFGKSVTHLLYLEVPVYALYRHYLPDNKGELFGGLGPYFGYGLTGAFKSTFNG